MHTTKGLMITQCIRVRVSAKYGLSPASQPVSSSASFREISGPAASEIAGHRGTFTTQRDPSFVDHPRGKLSFHTRNISTLDRLSAIIKRV